MLLEVAMSALISSTCGPTTEVLAELKSKYDERPVFHAAMPTETNEASQMTVTISSTTKTWSILFEPSPATSCIIAVGYDWVTTDPPPESPSPPAIRLNFETKRR